MVVLLVFIAVISFLLINNNENENSKKKVNNDVKEAITEQGIIKDETFGNLNFTNTTLIKDSKQYVLSMDVINPTQDEINMETINIDLKDKDGNLVVVLLGNIGDPMKPGETRTITSSVKIDLSKVKYKVIE